jgi:hypothetical protein
METFRAKWNPNFGRVLDIPSDTALGPDFPLCLPRLSHLSGMLCTPKAYRQEIQHFKAKLDQDHAQGSSNLVDCIAGQEYHQFRWLNPYLLVSHQRHIPVLFPAKVKGT